MSSETPTLQGLYDAEKARTQRLEKRNAILLERLESWESAYELMEEEKDATIQERDQTIQERDETIRQLQMALDNADRRATQGDAAQIQTLQARMERMRRNYKQFIDGNWQSILPQCNQNLKDQRNAYYNESQDLKRKLCESQAELDELRVSSDGLFDEYKNVMVEVEDHMQQHMLFDASIDKLKESLFSRWKGIEPYLNHWKLANSDTPSGSADSQDTAPTSPPPQPPAEDKSVQGLTSKAVSQSNNNPTKMVRKQKQIFPQAPKRPEDPRLPSQEPTKMIRSPTELEMLRLKERQTLHRLAPQ